MNHNNKIISQSSSIHHESALAQNHHHQQHQQQQRNEDMNNNASNDVKILDDQLIRHRGRYQAVTSPEQQSLQSQEQEPFLLNRSLSQNTPQQQRRHRRFVITIPTRLISILSHFGISTNHNNNGIRWEIPQSSTIVDTMIDISHTILEYFVYLIGPLLICLALGIVSLLVYTFVTILIPMIHRKHKHSLYYYQYVIILFHMMNVMFIVYNVLYNYYYCVITTHVGAKYDHLIREFAIACQMKYPETPQELQTYRKNYHSLMSIRMKRKQERIAEQQQQQAQQQQSKPQAQTPLPTIATTATAAPATSIPKSDVNGVSHIETGYSSAINVSSTNTSIPAPITSTVTAGSQNSQQQQSQQQQQKAVQQPKSPPMRLWTLMLPFEWGYCSSSNQPKPPRSHYDHVTKQLVLNLDHYCPWMFNVVGYFNYRYFLNFLIYVFVGMLYGTILLFEPFLFSRSKLYRDQIILQRTYERQHMKGIKNWDHRRQHHLVNPITERIRPMMPIQEEKMLITLSFMLCAAVGIAVFLLVSFHIYLTVTGQTTIEFHNNFHQRKLLRLQTNNKKKWINPYSLRSWRKNWEQVYGLGTSTSILTILLSLLPSPRERDYYPAPVPGNEIRFSVLQKLRGQQQGQVTAIPVGTDDDVDDHNSKATNQCNKETKAEI